MMSGEALDGIAVSTSDYGEVVSSEATELLGVFDLRATEYDYYNYTIPYEALFSEELEAVIITIYVAITILAVGGNCLVCYVVLAYQRMRTITNYFIVNLAVSDILMALLCIPLTFIVSFLLNYWPFGSALCRIIPYTQQVSVLVSAYTLVAISLDRYLAIIYPLRPRMDEFTARILIGVIWFIALMIALPTVIKSKILTEPPEAQPMKPQCREVWDPAMGGRLYGSALLVLQFLIPFIVLAFAYSHICYTMWGSRAPGEAQDRRDQRMERSKRKMIKMMVIVVLLFAFLWVPLNILLIVGDATEWDFPHSKYYYFICHWIAMSHSCVNPFIYCWMNSRFRKGFQHAFRFLPFVTPVHRPESPTVRHAESRLDTQAYQRVASHMDRSNTYTTSVRPTSYFRQVSLGVRCMGFKTDSENEAAPEPRPKVKVLVEGIEPVFEDDDDDEEYYAAPIKCCTRKKNQESPRKSTDNHGTTQAVGNGSARCLANDSRREEDNTDTNYNTHNHNQNRAEATIHQLTVPCMQTRDRRYPFREEAVPMLTMNGSLVERRSVQH